MPNASSTFSFRVEADRSGTRLDALVAAEVAQCSRSYAAALIRQGRVTVDDRVKKPGYTVKHGEVVAGSIPAPEPAPFSPEEIPLHILYEDTALLVVNKAPGMVVHPAPGHGRGTLANALLHHCPDLSGMSGCLRPGIVHRLDKDTTGALVVAKTSRAMKALAEQFKSREIRKQYLALVHGVPAERSGSIDRPIGRHPVDRKKMSVRTRTPRPALTYWRVQEAFGGAALLEVEIHTGRTHQIRVHCKSMGHPIIGDPVYFHRGDKKQLKAAADSLSRVVFGLERQMLHAWKLSFRHPLTSEMMTVTAPLPDDMSHLLARLRTLSADRSTQP